MKKTALIFLLILFHIHVLQAQPYNIAIGARFGKLNNGVTVKGFFPRNENVGIEAQLYSTLQAAQYGYSIKGFVFNQSTFKVPFIELPLDFIIGGGLQFGYFPYDAPGYYKIVNGLPEYYGKSVVTLGVAANIALEYQFKKRNLPFAIGIDAVPAYDFIHPGPDWFDFGVDFRYLIR